MYPPLPLAARVGNLRGLQGGTPIEAALLTGQLLYYAPHGTPNPGVNSTYAAGIDGMPTPCFHKTFAGVNAAVAHVYGQSPDTAPIHGKPYDELVPPCVLRELRGDLGSLTLGVSGSPADPAPLVAGHPQGLAAAFFDSLIAQQDRHVRNFRWDAALSRLGLIDHGYAFARPGDYLNAAVFIEARWARGAQALSASERAALGALVGSADLFGLAGIIESVRADALLNRARRMLARGEITKPGDF